VSAAGRPIAHSVYITHDHSLHRMGDGEGGGGYNAHNTQLPTMRGRNEMDGTTSPEGQELARGRPNGIGQLLAGTARD
jgi:hypothetical protein